MESYAGLLPAEDGAYADVGFRSRALELGSWLGWLAIAATLGGLALDAGSRHRWLLLGLTLTAAACNAAAMCVPWRDWLTAQRGRLLLDVWSGGLVGFVAVLVAGGGASFSLLLFLTAPFIAVVQVGWRRGFWLAVSAGTCALAAALIPLPAGATAMRLVLVATAVAVALVLTRAMRRETARADAGRMLAAEANHRIKNNLQTVADLVLLGRPFDDTAARIRSIATVHRLLAEADGAVDGRSLLASIAETVPVPVTVEARSVSLDAATAQRLGIAANELVTNAYRHGAPPIVVRLRSEPALRLEVEDAGTGPGDGEHGLGLELVRGLGRFELRPLPGGGTRAQVVFPGGPR